MAPPKSSPLRDELRAKTIGKPTPKVTEAVEIVIEGEKVTLELRLPSMKRIEELQTILEEKGGVAGLVAFLIECAHTPEGERLYDQTDAELLKTHPPTSWVMVLANKAATFVKEAVSADPEKAKSF